MHHRILLALLAVIFAGRASAETLAERYWRIHREREATTRYGAPPNCGTNAVDQDSPAPTASVALSPEDQRRFLAPVPTGLPSELAGGDLWYDALVIPEGNWLCECPVEGSTDTVWRAALCPSNILQAVVWRHSVGIAPTTLPVTIEHDPSRVIGRVEGLWYESGTGVIARISMSLDGYEEARRRKVATRLSPDVRCMTTVTNVAIRSDIWVHENQDWIAHEAARRGDIDADSITNVPAGVEAVVMAPIYLRGISLVRHSLLPTEWQNPVPEHLRDAYPTRPYRGWSWRR